MKAIAFLFLATIFIGKAFFYDSYRIQSSSMEPGFKPEDIIVAKKFGYGTYGVLGVKFIDKEASATIRRGEAIVFELPGNASVHWVKRVVGLPGDTVEIVSSQLIINGEPAETELLEESGDFVRYRQSLDSISYEIQMQKIRAGFLEKKGDGKWQVPHGHIFLVGDNRDRSNDSRYIGFVSLEDIIGRVVKNLDEAFEKKASE